MKKNICALLVLFSLWSSNSYSDICITNENEKIKLEVDNKDYLNILNSNGINHLDLDGKSLIEKRKILIKMHFDIWNEMKILRSVYNHVSKFRECQSYAHLNNELILRKYEERSDYLIGISSFLKAIKSYEDIKLNINQIEIKIDEIIEINSFMKDMVKNNG